MQDMVAMKERMLLNEAGHIASLAPALKVTNKSSIQVWGRFNETVSDT
jgi:hypothetical protein